MRVRPGETGTDFHLERNLERRHAGHQGLNQILEGGDPYDAEAKATARAVAGCLKLRDWDFAYQSQGMTEDKWLGPTVEATRRAGPLSPRAASARISI